MGGATAGSQHAASSAAPLPADRDEGLSCSAVARKQLVAKQKRQQLRVILAGMLVWMIGGMTPMVAQTQLLLNYFNGDTVALAAAMGRGHVLGALVGVFVAPIVGSCSDAFGPLPVLRLGTPLAMARGLVWLLMPNVTGLYIFDMLTPLAMNCNMLTCTAMIGNMYKDDRQVKVSVTFTGILRQLSFVAHFWQVFVNTSVHLGLTFFEQQCQALVGAMSMFFTLPFAGMIVCPLLGTFLSVRSQAIKNIYDHTFLSVIDCL